MSEAQNAVRRRVRIKTWAYIVTAAFTLLLCALLFLIQSRITDYRDQIESQARELRTSEKYPNGLFVDSVPIGSLSYEEAREQLLTSLENRCTLMTVTIRFGQEAYQLRITPDMLRTDLDDVLKEAQEIGKDLSDYEYRDFMNQLPYYPIDLSLNVEVDPSPLEEEVRARAEALSTPPVNALLLSFDPTKPEFERFSYKKEEYGVVVDPDWLWDAVRSEILDRQDGIVEVRSKTIMPSILVSDLERSNAKAASFSTLLPKDEVLCENLQLLCERLTGTVLQAGETFSWKRFVGELTGEAGYHMSARPEYAANQTATTLMNCAILAGFDIRTHSPDPDMTAFVPKGQEAKVGGDDDLEFVNTSGAYTVLILKADMEAGTLTAEIYGRPAMEPYKVEIHTTVKEKIPIPEDAIFVPSADVKRGKVVRAAGQEGCILLTYRIFADPETGNEIAREDVYTSEYPSVPRMTYYNPDDDVPEN